MGQPLLWCPYPVILAGERSNDGIAYYYSSTYSSLYIKQWSFLIMAQLNFRNSIVFSFLLLVCLTSVSVHAKPKLTWSEKSVDVEALNGTVVVKNVSFVSKSTIKDLSFKIGDDCDGDNRDDDGDCTARPELGSLIEVGHLTTMPAVAGTEVQLALVFSIPADTPEGKYSGTLHVRDGKRTIARPLQLKLFVSTGSAMAV